MRKAGLRRLGLAARNSLSQVEVLSKSLLILDAVSLRFPATCSDPNLLFYASFRNEVSTQEALKLHLARNGSLLLPKVNGESISIHRVFDFSELNENNWGILEPCSLYKIESQSLKGIKNVLVPGVAFDRDLNRVGFGRGFYDRLFLELPNAFKIALAFENQIIEKVETEKHDIKMDVIVTETQILDASSK